MKEAIYHVLPLNEQNWEGALKVIFNNHWESDAEPLMLKATQTMRANYSADWYDVLGSFPDRPHVKETLLAEVARNACALDAINRNGWQKEAIPKIVFETDASVRTRNAINPYVSLLSDYPNEPGVKEVMMRFVTYNFALLPILVKTDRPQRS